jgi:hypothetical protein
MTKHGKDHLCLVGFNELFSWNPSATQLGKYWVMAHSSLRSFVSDGWAIVDDFGNLVKVES